MDSNKNLDLSRKAYPYDENLRVAYMLGLKEGYDQAMQDFLEKAEGFLTGRIVSCFRVSLTEQQTPFLDFNIKDIVEQFKNYMQNEM